MSSDSADARERALAYLAAHQVMTLATNGPQGLWAAAVFYAHDGFRLYFLSSGHTRHAQNIAISPLVAATIQEDYADWGEIKGIQLEGEVEQLDGHEREEAIALYRTRHPFLHNPPVAIASALRKVNWYRLTPLRLYFVDNSRGFGHRDEITLP